MGFGYGGFEVGFGLFGGMFAIVFLLIVGVFIVVIVYVTFQVESGDRIEFIVTGSEYGMLAEGDRGKLSFQGTRYFSYERS